jgi:hypothetical protein
MFVTRDSRCRRVDAAKRLRRIIGGSARKTITQRKLYIIAQQKWKRTMVKQTDQPTEHTTPPNTHRHTHTHIHTHTHTHKDKQPTQTADRRHTNPNQASDDNTHTHTHTHNTQHTTHTPNQPKGTDQIFLFQTAQKLDVFSTSIVLKNSALAGATCNSLFLSGLTTA